MPDHDAELDAIVQQVEAAGFLKVMIVPDGSRVSADA
jgi:hypothetical protein